MRLFYLLILVIAFGCTVSEPPENPVIHFNIKWKFITGDSAIYNSPGFDDSGWADIGVDKIWEEQGYDPYDGYAWFRTKIVIPSSLRDKSFLKDSLRIFLGKINNFDQTFLNGAIIGINGINVKADVILDESFKKAPTNYWDRERRYTLASDDPRIKWDQENVFAVRVFDEGGQGGLYTGNQEISMISVKEYLNIDSDCSSFIFEGKNLKKSFSLNNLSKGLVLKGNFSISAIGKIDSVILHKHKNYLELKPGESEKFEISIEQLDQSALFTYEFEFENANQSLIVKEESPYILTPVHLSEPRINGPEIYGARPGKPFLFSIPASGERPMTFEATDLPEGLLLDRNTGIISGNPLISGEFNAMLKAINNRGEFQKTLRIIIGEQIALTPPMGWNSWNCWGLSVDTEKTITSARIFRQKGLADHGWCFINIDDGWEIHKDNEPKRDQAGFIITNEKFPDMKVLGDSIHAMGLKFGIYSSPGPLTCGGYTASYRHEIQDARSFASWGVDYLKYDWCSYDKIAKDHSAEELKKPYFVMRDCLNKVDRNIVYSLCQYGMGNVWEWGAEVGGNLWRTTGDITDTWQSMSGIGFSQVENAPFAGPGHWNDPDMLVVGWVGWGPSLHPSRLTPDEQYTHISLWCLLSAPLLIGCDLEKLDEFTLNLLTNDEVIAIDQDIAGMQAVPLVKTEKIQVWKKNLSDGNFAIGIFNLGEQTENYILNLPEIGMHGELNLRDLWRHKDLGEFSGTFSTIVPSHGVMLIKLSE
jgi:hypothetical protein